MVRYKKKPIKYKGKIVGYELYRARGAFHDDNFVGYQWKDTKKKKVKRKKAKRRR